MDVVKIKRLAEKYKKLYGLSTNLNNLDGFTPPSNLVTNINYPTLSLGILLSNDNDVEYYDNPIFWIRKKVDIDSIIEHRIKMINARRIVDVNMPKKNDKLYNEILEAALSVRSISVEVTTSKIWENYKLSKLFAFFGFKTNLESIKISENPKIPDEIYKIEDLKAREAVYLLYKKNLSDYYISRLFSLGFFGNKINKKLVPSKWAITAVQKIIEDNIRKEIKHKKVKVVEKYYIFNYKIFGNDFYGFFIPGHGSVELIECILPRSAYNMNGNHVIIGRDEESGGYYSLRLSFSEFINYNGIIGDLIVFRVITEEYKLPLGVWVVREGTKSLFENVVGKFDNYKEAYQYLDNLISRKYHISLHKLRLYSKILNKKSILSFI